MKVGGTTVKHKTLDFEQNTKKCEGNAVKCDEVEPSQRRMAIRSQPLDLRPNGWSRLSQRIAIAIDERDAHL